MLPISLEQSRFYISCLSNIFSIVLFLSILSSIFTLHCVSKFLVTTLSHTDLSQIPKFVLFSVYVVFVILPFRKFWSFLWKSKQKTYIDSFTHITTYVSCPVLQWALVHSTSHTQVIREFHSLPMRPAGLTVWVPNNQRASKIPSEIFFWLWYYLCQWSNCFFS